MKFSTAYTSPKELWIGLAQATTLPEPAIFAPSSYSQFCGAKYIVPENLTYRSSRLTVLASCLEKLTCPEGSYEKTLPLPYVSLFPVDYGFRLGILVELSRETDGSGH